jgi:hypothetical protein
MDDVRLNAFAVKYGGWGIALVLFVAFAYLTAIVTRTIIAKWPRIAYYSQKPSTENECKQIHAGMDLPQVLGVINRKAEPFEEVLKPDRFAFWREGYNSCVVELDPNTQRVARTHLEESPDWSRYFPGEEW